MKISRPSLLIVGHGSSTSAEAEEAVREHAITLRQSNRYGQVDVFFLQGKTSLPSLPDGEVFVLPFFMSDGFFVTTKIPEMFDLEDGVRIDGDQHVFQCDAIGVDPGLSDILQKMALDICTQQGYLPRKTELILVAHGSGKSDASSNAARIQCDALRAGKQFHNVRTGFLEQEPRLGDVLNACDPDHQAVVVLGLFAADGPHAADDVPKLLEDWHMQQVVAGTARNLLPLHYGGAVGVRSEIVRLIQESVSRCAARHARKPE